MRYPLVVFLQALARLSDNVYILARGGIDKDLSARAVPSFSWKADERAGLVPAFLRKVNASAKSRVSILGFPENSGTTFVLPHRNHRCH
jgi:hypothetical protein